MNDIALIRQSPPCGVRHHPPVAADEAALLDTATVDRIVALLERLKAAHQARMDECAQRHRTNPAPYLAAYNKLQGVGEALHQIRALDQPPGFGEFPR